MVETSWECKSVFCACIVSLVTAELPDNVDLQPWSTGRGMWALVGIALLCDITSCDSVVGVVQHVYFVTCLKLGEQTLTIVVGNGPTLKNLYPAQAEASSRWCVCVCVCMCVCACVRPCVRASCDIS